MTRKVSTPAAYKLMHDGALALVDVEANGICIDHVYLAKATKMIKRRIKLNDEKLRKSKVYSKWRRMYGAKTNLDSGKQLSHVLDLPDSQETTLEALGSKFTKAYLRNKKYKKLLSTQLLGIRREMYRVGNKWFISPFFNLHLVRTYRSSSDRINFQNIPIRDEELAEIVRQIFIPRASNRVIIEIDYGGIEVKIAACYHKDPVMLDYLNDPTKDMHTDTASQCYKIKKSDVTKKVRHAAKNQFVFPEFYGSVY